jgi:protein-S-isoprenylcysteine O-methyltransferase Ste14
MSGQDKKPRTAGVAVRPPLLFLSGLVLGAIAGWLLPLDAGAALAGPSRWIAGAAVVVLGAALLAWAFRLFRASGTPVPTSRPTNAIVTDGPYRFSRNPIYLGLSLVYIGIALGFGLWWALALLPLLWIILHFGVVRREEAYLEARFGEAYKTYRNRTHRYI